MALDKIVTYFTNVKGGPISTVIGLLMFIFGGVMIWKMDGLSWASVETGVFILGILLLLKSDTWIKGLFKKKDAK